MATGGYKVTKFHPVCKGIGVAHSTVSISRAVQPWEREGAMLSSVSEGGKNRRLRNAGNSRIRELQRKLYQKAKQVRKPLEEDDRKAVFGKTERTV
jgi:hypothetical protein